VWRENQNPEKNSSTSTREKTHETAKFQRGRPHQAAEGEKRLNKNEGDNTQAGVQEEKLTPLEKEAFKAPDDRRRIS